MTLLACLLLAHLAPSGLVTKDVKVGIGHAAAKGDLLAMDYTGKLQDGKVFDSSKGRAPFNFVLGQGEVIKGWDQGLLGIKPGGKRILTIPPDLAYGANGSPPVIPPNSTLTFEVTCLGIEPAGKKQIIHVAEVKVGKGAPAKKGDSVSIKYTGKFLNGLVFDSNVKLKEPFTFTLGQGMVIQGFDQGVAGMRVGGQRKIVVPPDLGYGSRAMPKLPANSTLVFVVTLTKIQKGSGK